ncbi:MAG: metalloregulator ArsR/SmtB family transcription factor [Gemmatimonadaceae bacterium]
MISDFAILDCMTALADSTRSRLLLVLERHECTVTELCTVLQLPQSTVSRHLKVLADEGLVGSRQEGTSRYYRMSRDRVDPGAQRLWRIVREQISESAAADQDAHRLDSVLLRRRERSHEFFSGAAAEWDRLRTELFGRRSDLVGLMGLVDDRWTVGDLGCGTGQLTEAIAPFVERVVAIDSSEAMLGSAKKRLAGVRNVHLRRGELENLPVADDSLDAALLFLVLHYLPEPALAIAEAARVVRPGGRILVVDMMPHDHAEYRQTMGHVWQGFSEDTVTEWFTAEQLEGARYHALPADAEAKGPALFSASARVPEAAPLAGYAARMTVAAADGDAAIPFPKTA